MEGPKVRDAGCESMMLAHHTYNTLLEQIRLAIFHFCREYMYNIRKCIMTDLFPKFDHLVEFRRFVVDAQSQSRIQFITRNISRG